MVNCQALELVEVEYVPEKAELDGMLDEELRKVFEKFNFMENAVTEVRLWKAFCWYHPLLAGSFVAFLIFFLLYVVILVSSGE